MSFNSEWTTDYLSAARLHLGSSHTASQTDSWFGEGPERGEGRLKEKRKGREAQERKIWQIIEGREGQTCSLRSLI